MERKSAVFGNLKRRGAVVQGKSKRWHQHTGRGFVWLGLPDGAPGWFIIICMVGGVTSGPGVLLGRVGWTTNIPKHGAFSFVSGISIDPH